VQTRLEHLPLDKADLLLTLGGVHLSLGALPRAEDLLRDVHALRRTTLGPFDLATLEAATALGGVLTQTRKLPEARETLESALTALRERHAGAHVALAAAKNNLAAERLARSDIAGARELLEDALGSDAPALGGGTEEVLKLHLMLGAVHYTNQRFDDALTQYQLALAICRRLRGERSVMSATILTNIAGVQTRVNALDAAEASVREALDTQSLALGPEHPHRVIALVNLADIQSARGDVEGALATYGTVLAVRTKTLDADDPRLLSIHSSIGLALTKLGRFEQAEPHARRAYERLLATVPNDTLFLPNATSNLARLLALTERFVEAEPLARKVYEQRRVTLAADDPHKLISQEIWVRVLLGLGRRAEGLSLARELLQLTSDQALEREERADLLRRLEAPDEVALEASTAEDA
jgi:serine/threonine-protein kinase